MKIQTFLILGCLIIYISADGKMNSTKCDVFTDKLGSCATAISFKGNVSISGEGEDALVEISYMDDKYYLDTSLFGLVTEDGKTPETTCLDLRIYRYYDGLTNSGLVNDLQVTSSHDDANRQRSYIITFKGNDFENRLNKSISTQYYTYSGAYSLVFKLSQDPWQIQYIYRFSFSIKLNIETRKILDTQFNSISSSDSVQNCNFVNDPESNLQPVSSLVFCQDYNCTKIFTYAPNFYQNEDIFMLHKTTTFGLTQYTYSDSRISLVADGLLKSVSIDRIVYDTNIGQAIYNFKAPLVWSKLTIQATTHLVSQKNRLLTFYPINSTSDQIIANSEEICIGVQGETGCPTCTAICMANNGDSPAICDCSLVTGEQILILAIFLVLSMS